MLVNFQISMDADCQFTNFLKCLLTNDVIIMFVDPVMGYGGH